MPQTTKDYFKSEYNRNLAEAQAISDKIESEGRSPTSEEREQVKGLVSQAESFRQKFTALEEGENLRKSIEQMTGVFNTPAESAPEGAKSIGDAFVKSSAFQALTKGALSSGQWTTGAVDVGNFEDYEVGGKATVTTIASPVVQPGAVQGPFRILTDRLHVRDLLAPGTTDSNAVPVVRETTATNAAAGVAEGAAKPESTLIFTQVNEPVKKIATFLPVSDEMFEDVPAMRSYIDGRLRLFVEEAEDGQLLTGAGAGNNVQGITTRTGVQTGTKAALQTASGAANPTVADAVYAAITAIRTNAFAEPDGAVFHPTNWMTVRLLKDTANQYFGGGPFTGAYGNGGGIAADNIWGLPTVVTSRMTLHTALVGAFRTQAQIFDRSGLVVEASNSHADFFQLNLTALRAERRLALAVYRPAAFHLITALNI